MFYEMISKFSTGTGTIRAIRYNIDGNYCISTGSDRKIKLYNPITTNLLKTYCAHSDEVLDAVGSCDSNNLLSGSLDKSMIYWDVSTGKPLRQFRSHAGGVTCVQFNKDSILGASGSRDNTVHCFDIRSRSTNPIQILREAKDCITGLVIIDGKIITSSLDGCIRQNDLRAGIITNFKINTPITSLAISSDEQCFLIGCLDGIIRLIDVDNGDILAEFKSCSESKNYRIECEFLSSNEYIITGSSKGEAIIYNILELNEVKRIPICDKNVIIQSLSRHPLCNDVLFANQNEIQLWSLKEILNKSL